MEQLVLLDHFYGYFNLVLGAFLILVGFKIYKPSRDEAGEKRFQKIKNFYRFAGIGLFVWGLVKVF